MPLAKYSGVPATRRLKTLLGFFLLITSTTQHISALSRARRMVVIVGNKFASTDDTCLLKRVVLVGTSTWFDSRIVGASHRTELLSVVASGKSTMTVFAYRMSAFSTSPVCTRTTFWRAVQRLAGTRDVLDIALAAYCSVWFSSFPLFAFGFTACFECPCSDTVPLTGMQSPMFFLSKHLEIGN